MRSSAPAVTDVYTNLNGLQNLKVEKDNELALRKVSEQFESMFINMLMKNMRSANQVFSEGNMFDSQESQFYRDMYDHQLSLSLAHGRGFGIADAMYRQLSQSYGEGNGPKTRSISIAPGELRVAPQIVDNAVLGMNQPAAISSESTNQTGANLSNDHVIASDRSKIASSPEDFIIKVFDGATKAAKELGVEREILIAQAALETGWGQKVFAQSNGESTYNLFNIKADQRWQGESVVKNTLEYLGGQFSTVAAKFRSYDSIQQSFEDFTQFIKNGERYLPTLETTSGGIDFIQGIHQAGYATDPEYVEKISSVYDRIRSFLNSRSSVGVSP